MENMFKTKEHISHFNSIHGRFLFLMSLFSSAFNLIMIDKHQLNNLKYYNYY
jgi:hypothetical protein